MDLIRLASETLDVVDRGTYAALDPTVDFPVAVRAAIADTRGITPEDAAALAARLPRDLGAPATYEVVDASAVEVCRRLAVDREVTVLNFASALTVGGGFLHGATAQEEDLCRCSALYRCLERVDPYYRANQACGTHLYTDHAIWSPDVPFFRDEGLGWLPRPFRASVLTSPAPNTKRSQEGAGELAATFRRRAHQVLAIAAAEPPKAIVLGAWGCGAFGGDAKLVAEVFHEALSGPFARAFERVVFAVLVRRWPDNENLAAFQARFMSRT